VRFRVVESQRSKSYSSLNVESWNRLAGTLQSSFPLTRVPRPPRYDSSSRVLDYGCGEGRLLRRLERWGCRNLFGYDPAPRMAHLAGQKCNDVVFLSRDDIDRGLTFDWIYLVGVLSSLVPESDRAQTVEDLAQMLHRGGSFVIADFGESNHPPYPERYRNAEIEPRTFVTSDGLVIHHFVATELVCLASRAGLSIVDRQAVQATSVHGHALPGHIVIARRDK
jgi:SAM-dependent methyltransferase